MFRELACAVLLVPALGCSAPAGGAPAPQGPPVTTVAPVGSAVPVVSSSGSTTAVPSSAGAPASVPSLEATAHLDRWLEAPCFAFSEQRRSLACVEATLDMGFVSARFVVLNVDERRETMSVSIYEGRSEIETQRIDKAALARCNGVLRDGAFVSDGTAVARGDVVRTPDGYFRVGSPVGNMAGKIPSFDRNAAPAGFTGDANTCMSWDPLSGIRYRFVTALRIESMHEFTTEAGKPCGFAGAVDLNDETFPAEARWLVLFAK